MPLTNIVTKSSLHLASRLDAEHYSPRFTPILEQIERHNPVRLRRILSEPVKTGHTPSTTNPNYYTPGTIKFIKTDNVREDRITDDVQMLSEAGNLLIGSSELRADDVIVTIIGATEEIIGRAARVDQSLGRANINQNVAVIRTSLPAGFLTIFLNTIYGREQLIWLSRQTGQVNLNCREVEELRVPRLSEVFTDKIQKLNDQRHTLLLRSGELYFQAQHLLVSELGLLNWEPPPALSFVRRFSEVMRARRTDAEHFQPKYDEVVTAVSRFGASPLIAHAKRTTERVRIDPSIEYRYIEISDVNTRTAEVEFTERKGDDLPANARLGLKGGELIISKVRPTRGAVGIVPDECSENSVCSSAFSVYRVDSPLREYLQVVLRSPLGKLQLEKQSKGTSYPTIDDADVQNVLIPTLTNPTIEKIAALVEESFAAQRKAKALLQSAKLAVETAIAESEERAMSHACFST
jgi:type I restriction enzyme, S subunit